MLKLPWLEWTEPSAFSPASTQTSINKITMEDNVQDALILAFIALLGLMGGYLLWLWLGAVGFAGLLFGYLTGLLVYFAPLPEA